MATKKSKPEKKDDNQCYKYHYGKWIKIDNNGNKIPVGESKSQRS